MAAPTIRLAAHTWAYEWGSRILRMGVTNILLAFFRGIGEN
jgi:hypothetical protein